MDIAAEQKHKVAFVVLSVAALITLSIIIRGTFSADVRHTEIPLPASIGVWTKTNNMSFRNDVFEMLGTGDVRGASFTNTEGETVQVILVRAVNNRAAFHPPEYCLTGGGRELVEQRVVTVSAPGKEPFPCAVNEMVFKERSGRRLLVWNWYLVGTAMMPNFYKQQVKLFTDIFTGGSGAGAMINMYTEVQDGNVDAATRRVTDLSYAILPLLREPQ